MISIEQEKIAEWKCRINGNFTLLVDAIEWYGEMEKISGQFDGKSIQSDLITALCTMHADKYTESSTGKANSTELFELIVDDYAEHMVGEDENVLLEKSCKEHEDKVEFRSNRYISEKRF